MLGLHTCLYSLSWGLLTKQTSRVIKIEKYYSRVCADAAAVHTHHCFGCTYITPCTHKQLREVLFYYQFFSLLFIPAFFPFCPLLYHFFFQVSALHFPPPSCPHPPPPLFPMVGSSLSPTPYFAPRISPLLHGLASTLSLHLFISLSKCHPFIFLQMNRLCWWKRTGEKRTQ